MTPARPRAPLALASNRGPVTYTRAEDGMLSERRGAGGLVTAVAGALRESEALWVAAAITDGDRDVAASGETRHVALGDGGARVRLLDVPEKTYAAYYNEFSNRILWFLHHDLWDTPRAPSFGPAEAEHWERYREVNARFASALAEEAAEGAVAMPQDYQLSLVPKALAAQRPDLRIAFYWHIPFAGPERFRVLPDAWGRALLEGVLGAHVAGFQSRRWANAFLACCRDILGVTVKGGVVHHDGRRTRVGVYPVGVNPAHIRQEAAGEAVERAVREIDEMAAGRALIVRVDRTELSKNILRGLAAYALLLERRPDLHERVVHLARLTPSRGGIPEYETYMREVREAAERINGSYGRPGWDPIVLEETDDFARTLAAYRRYDVLVVNTIADGMNLVAREGPLLNERDGTLVLSHNAGAADELDEASSMVNPFDIDETARAIEAALDASPGERAERAARLRPLAEGTPPQRWLESQIRDARRSFAAVSASPRPRSP